MILPNGSNSKYIKTVIGIFVLFTIISPLIHKITGKNNLISFKSYNGIMENDALTTSSNVDNNKLIKQMYEENLKIDIKAKLSQKGYQVGNINVEILDNEEYTLNSIDVRILNSNRNTSTNNNQTATTIVENVENVLINISGGNATNTKVSGDEKSVLSEGEKRKIIQYLCSVYEVREENIVVN